MTEHAATEKKTILPWLTGEVALYGLILCLALALRLGGLEIRIVDVPEAEQAWQAWQLANGHAPTGGYSPLLLSGQALLFFLFGASDVIARLLPALAGSAMVILTYLMRSHLGRVGSLVSALALALSPTLVYSARYGDGATLLLACVLGSMALWLAFQKDRRPAYLYAIAVVGGFAVLADPRAIGVLIVLGVAWAVGRFVLGWSSARTDAEQPIPWRALGLTLAVTLVLVATAFAFNPGGLGAWADFPSAWGAHFAPVVNGQPWYYPLGALLMYEPFLLIFGIIGAVDMFIRRDRAAVFLWMAVGLLIVASLAGGRDAGDVALLCMPLAVLAGRAVDNLVGSWRKDASLQREGLFVLVTLGILVYVALEASFYARSLYLGLPEAAQFLWFWLLAIALIVVLVGLSMAWFGMDVTWRAGGAVVALVLLLCAFSATTSLNFRYANDPRELHILTASNEGIRDALEVMADLSYHGRGHPAAAPVTVEARLGPVWLWYLRDWENVTFVRELTPNVTTPLALSSEDGRTPALGDQYVGQAFVTQTWWEPSQLVSTDQVSWWLYRKSVEKPVPDPKVILWMRVEEQVASNE